MTLYCPECSSTFEDHGLDVCPDDGTRLYMVEADQDEDPLIGAVIDGRFRVDRQLGFGGMGTVYRGVQLSVHRDVAIKVLRTELANREVALERFFREAKVISGLSHPNIVRLVDFGQDRDRDILFLVMELVEGESLTNLIRSGRMKTGFALEVVYQVCGALTEPHSRGVIHRDLKPDNLLLKPMSDGTVQTKVLDFGIARALESNTQLTATGMICGTPAYMAPEQAQNEDLDPRTDLYALGVILYEMLSGWPPFTGTSSLQIMLKHIQEKPAPLRELLPPAALAPPVEDLCYRMMSKEPERRLVSARDVRDVIDDIRRELDLDPVRVDPDADPDEMFDDLLMEKLPRGEKQKSGPTEMLQRDTGAESWFTRVDDDKKTNVYHGDSDSAPEVMNDTDAGEHHVTYPLTPDEGEVEPVEDVDREDADREDADREDADQEDTEKVDVFAATKAAASTPVASPKLDRQTLVEDSGKRPDIGARHDAQERGPDESTDEGRRAFLDSDPTVRPVMKSGEDGNRRLIVIASVLSLLVVGAAIFVIVEVRKLSGDSADAASAPPASPVVERSGSSESEEPDEPGSVVEKPNELERVHGEASSAIAVAVDTASLELPEEAGSPSDENETTAGDAPEDPTSTPPAPKDGEKETSVAEQNSVPQESPHDKREPNEAKPDEQPEEETAGSGEGSGESTSKSEGDTQEKFDEYFNKGGLLKEK